MVCDHEMAVDRALMGDSLQVSERGNMSEQQEDGESSKLSNGHVPSVPKSLSGGEVDCLFIVFIHSISLVIKVLLC